MQPIQQAWDTAEPEELLHHNLFAALGVPNWSIPFADLAQRLPWSAQAWDTISWLRQPPRSACAELCRLFPETPPNAIICPENTPTVANSGNAWRITIA